MDHIQKIKIAHLTSAHPFTDIRIFHKQSVSLVENGYDVYLIATNCESQLMSGVTIIGIDREGKGRFSRMLNTTRDVYRKALELNADVYHFHDPELLPYALKLTRRGKKVIYDVHEDVPKQIMDKHWIPKIFRGIISFMFAAYESYVAKRIAGIISVTDIICDRFRRVNSNVEMVANYPLLEETKKLQSLNIEKNERQICYIGGLFPTRGVKELVQALEKIDVKLVLAGKFAPAQFENEVRQLKGWEKVDFLGHIDRDKIISVLKSSYAGLVTLHPTRSYKEALPIKMFEYMAAGIPVIASDFPIWRKIIEDANCGICIDPLDVNEISNGIEFFLDNPKKAEEMGRNGQEAFLNKYNWSVEEQKLLAFYKNLISK
jgi:glycosyltransferase involved in cell wall biosynthesis